jgi:hypothetical protein
VSRADLEVALHAVVNENVRVCLAFALTVLPGVAARAHRLVAIVAETITKEVTQAAKQSTKIITSTQVANKTRANTEKQVLLSERKALLTRWR